MDSLRQGQLDESTSLPPLIRTDDTGSFAEKTLRVRLPEQIDQLLGLELPEPGAPTALEGLAERLSGGSVRDLLRDRPDVAAGMQVAERADWQAEIASNLGSPWSALPWYFAESLFYLETLAACGYYDPDSPAYAQDPFESFKRHELLRPHGGIERAGRILDHVSTLTGTEERLVEYLLHALWGNRIDLTFSELVARYGTSGQLGGREELLIDHSSTMARKAVAASRVDLVLDNAGTELVCDLLLARALLENGTLVILHVKGSPFYVSDSMAKDVHAAVAALAGSADASTHRAGDGLQRALNSRRLLVHPHWFWNGPRMYADWPREIRSDLEGADLILFKGDVNYRRLLGDRRWDPQTPMGALTGYVPSAFGALRTLKSELVVDLPLRQVEELSRNDPKWSVSGRYGVARFLEPTRGS